MRNLLEPVSILIEWCARLAAPATLAAFALCSLGAATYRIGHGDAQTVAALAVLAALGGIGAAILAVRAIRRLRHGPPTDPPSLNR